MLESLFNLVVGLRVYNVKKRLYHKCFPVNSVKFLRTPILQNICERLLLQIDSIEIMLVFEVSSEIERIQGGVKIFCRKQ